MDSARAPEFFRLGAPLMSLLLLLIASDQPVATFTSLKKSPTAWRLIDSHQAAVELMAACYC